MKVRLPAEAYCTACGDDTRTCDCCDWDGDGICDICKEDFPDRETLCNGCVGFYLRQWSTAQPRKAP